MAYKLLVALIKAGKTTGIADKADVFFAAGRITEEEYMRILSMLGSTGTPE